jgi:hypothetical protein
VLRASIPQFEQPSLSATIGGDDDSSFSAALAAMQGQLQGFAVVAQQVAAVEPLARNR